MSAQDEIKKEVGTLYSNTAPQPLGNIRPTSGNLGTLDEEGQLEALRADIRQIYGGLLLIGRQIDDLRSSSDRG